MSHDMMPMQESYGGTADAKMLRMPTIAQRIDAAVQQAEERLKAAKRAKELFEKNPDLEELLNIMQKAHF